jgi:hypothetical protein
MRIVVNDNPQHFQWMKNLHEPPHMASMDNVDWDCRGFFETVLEDRQGGMCGGP